MNKVRAVFFDAVGTVIHPCPGAAEVYARIGARFGSKLEPAEIDRRFRRFFQAEEEADVRTGWATSEERERRRWQTIVAAVLTDVADRAACFAAIYAHFSRGESWSCAPDLVPVLRALREGGLQIGLASNYDHRLRLVAAELEPLRSFDHVVISAEIGFRKPAAEFFQALSRATGLPPSEILYVGDDRVNDFDGARRAGLRALLLDPSTEPAPGRIRSLQELMSVSLP